MYTLSNCLLKYTDRFNIFLKNISLSEKFIEKIRDFLNFAPLRDSPKVTLLKMNYWFLRLTLMFKTRNWLWFSDRGTTSRFFIKLFKDHSLNRADSLKICLLVLKDTSHIISFYLYSYIFYYYYYYLLNYTFNSYL